MACSAPLLSRKSYDGRFAIGLISLFIEILPWHSPAADRLVVALPLSAVTNADKNECFYHGSCNSTMLDEANIEDHTLQWR